MISYSTSNFIFQNLLISLDSKSMIKNLSQLITILCDTFIRYAGNRARVAYMLDIGRCSSIQI